MIQDDYGRLITTGPGSTDDGSPDGAVRSLLASGELFKAPFLDGLYTAELAASSTSYLVTGGNKAAMNSDGSGTYLAVTPQDAITHFGGARIWVNFHGTRFGVRHGARVSYGYSPGFSVWIDGISYEVRHHVDAILVAEANSAIDYTEFLWMCPDVLRDHRHVARIQLPGAMGTSNLPSYLTGLVLERRPGNGDPLTNRHAFPLATGQLTNAFITIPIGSGANVINGRLLRRIDYYNTDSASHTVQVSAGGSVIWETVLPAAGTAGASASWAPDPYMNVNGGTDTTYSAYYQHKADTGAKVNYHVVGGV